MGKAAKKVTMKKAALKKATPKKLVARKAPSRASLTDPLAYFVATYSNL